MGKTMEMIQIFSLRDSLWAWGTRRFKRLCRDLREDCTNSWTVVVCMAFRGKHKVSLQHSEDTSSIRLLLTSSSVSPSASCGGVTVASEHRLRLGHSHPRLVWCDLPRKGNSPCVRSFGAILNRGSYTIITEDCWLQ